MEVVIYFVLCPPLAAFFNTGLARVINACVNFSQIDQKPQDKIQFLLQLLWYGEKL